jgi:hypothetical protein
MSETTHEGRVPTCPYCFGVNFHRSRRRGPTEWILRYLLFLAPYRCNDCDGRIFVSLLRHHHRKARRQQVSDP